MHLSWLPDSVWRSQRSMKNKQSEGRLARDERKRQSCSPAWLSRKRHRLTKQKSILPVFFFFFLSSLSSTSSSAFRQLREWGLLADAMNRLCKIWVLWHVCIHRAQEGWQTWGQNVFSWSFRCVCSLLKWPLLTHFMHDLYNRQSHPYLERL